MASLADKEDKLKAPLADESGGSAPAHAAGPPAVEASALITSILTSSTSGAQAGYRLRPDVLLILVQDGTARLLDLAGNVYAVSATGAAMLEAVLFGSPEAACQTLAARFNIGIEQVRTDMVAFLDDLGRQNLLNPRRISADTKRSVSATCAWLIAPLLHLCARAPHQRLRTTAWALLVLAYASTRIFGWTNTVRVWARCTLKSTDPRSLSLPDHAKLTGEIDRTVSRAIALHPLNLGCKERALCCWVLARAIGLPARIVLGVDLFPLALHCWCESGSFILADRYDGKCDRYTPILTYK